MRYAFTCEKCGRSFAADAAWWPISCCGVRQYLPVGATPSRARRVKPPLAPADGPGTELERIFHKAGANSDECAGMCRKWRDKMNRWGVEECRLHRVDIVRRITEAMFRTWVTDQIKIGWSISRESWFNPLDPVGCIVDEAIQRAEAKVQ